MFKSLDSIASVVEIFMYQTIKKIKQVLRSRKGLDYNTAAEHSFYFKQHSNNYVLPTQTLQNPSTCGKKVSKLLDFDGIGTVAKCKASMAWLYTVLNPTKAAGGV